MRTTIGGFELVTLDQIPDYRNPSLKWGRWQYDRELMTLTITPYDGRPYEYEIDLETCTSASQVLDWIMQIANKTWCSASDLRDLIIAFRDLLNPQGYLCHGHSRSRLLGLRQIITANVAELTGEGAGVT